MTRKCNSEVVDGAAKHAFYGFLAGGFLAILEIGLETGFGAKTDLSSILITTLTPAILGAIIGAGLGAKRTIDRQQEERSTMPLNP